MLVRRLALGLAVTCFVAACAKNPTTGRRQFNVVPDSVMHDLGKQAFQEMLANEEVERAGPDSAVLKRVGGRLATVVNRDDYDWRFALIESEEQNAWALPGGYIGFYEGILPVLRNEAGMAFVMGHEVAHTTSNHGGERLSQQLAVAGGLTVLDAYLSGREDVSGQSRQMILGALGLGAQVGVLLPFSRTQESEADVVGLMYMARAGYPPQESIRVWDRMAKAGGQRPPEFLSTHPDPVTRQATLREWMPRAEKRYQRNALGDDTLRPLWTERGRRDTVSDREDTERKTTIERDDEPGTVTTDRARARQQKTSRPKR
jgi:predicted Zn-dependent protease